MTTKGQVWTLDFVISIVIFLIAVLISFNMLSNSIGNDQFEQVRDQSAAAASLLVGEGYPQNWENSTLVKAGLASDGQLSLRKTTELAVVPIGKIKQSLRLTDNVYVYVTNSSNDTIPVFGACGVGDATVTAVAGTITLPAIAITNGTRVITAMVINNLSIMNATLLEQLPIAAYGNLTAHDVLIIEGNISSVAAQEALLRLGLASRRGITVIIIGDPGFPAFGLNVNVTAATNITVGPQGTAFGLASGDSFAVDDVIPTIEPPTDVGVAPGSFAVFGTTDNLGKAAYATWVYNDAKVWYFASRLGNNATMTFSGALAQGVLQHIEPSWPACGALAPPTAKQRAITTRTLPYHDQFVTLNVLVWRNS